MPGDEWEAERTVDAALAARLVAGQFPEHAGLDVVPFAEGWDNTVHLVGGTWAFRFPRRAVALPGVARETALLPQLAARLPLAVPVPELLGRPSADFGWPFTGARLLPGTELADAGLTDRSRLAGQLGAFLRRLHDVHDVGADLPVDPLGRADAAGRAERALPWLERLFEDDLDPRITALLAEASRLGPSTRTPVLVHGDLHVRHVLVADGAATGVIDWGDVCRADPAVDLSLAYAAVEGADRAALLAAYGEEPDDETELRARALAVFLSAALAGYASAAGRRQLRTEALDGLRRAVR